METAKVGNLQEVKVVFGDSQEGKLKINAEIEKLKEVEWVGNDSQKKELQEKVKTHRLKVSYLFLSNL